ncbi:MAG: prepilin-type N-terminal cleavage/methylation domain-containing protein [bacterium]|nr:prepilin-type N-terminal cleavage/methylation domain-containing protein [bacterium]
MKKFKAGFTLIELLIVIALLGALAVGLLAALDPFEQLKKGNDTAVRNTVSEVQGSLVRYYALKNILPWCSDPDTCSDPSGTNLSSSPMDVAISRVIDSGELKKDFTSLAANNLGKIWVTGVSTTNTAKVCFRPSSKSFKCDLNTKFDKNGEKISPDTNCTNNCGSNTCYWCVE